MNMDIWKGKIGPLQSDIEPQSEETEVIICHGNRTKCHAAYVAHDKKVYPDTTPELFEPCVAWSYVTSKGGNTQGGGGTIINIITPSISPESVFHNLAAFLGPKPLIRHECKLKD